MTDFEKEVIERIQQNQNDADLKQASLDFTRLSTKPQYSYNFFWLGRPIIQYPQDMVAMQELIWRIRPDLIVETGIAHGGSLILSASMLAMIEYCDAITQGTTLHPDQPKRKVVGIDIDIRAHNRQAILDHPMANRIAMIEGSSIDPDIVARVTAMCRNYKRVLVLLDSNHTHDHVRAELDAYAPLVSPGSYCVVFDTIIQDLPEDMYSNRPWGPGNNPKTAVYEFLSSNSEFEIDAQIDNKLLISVAPDGYLRKKP